jgi:hypothetical protein
MGPQGIRELVGRLMVDPDFLNELVGAPETVLSRYQLSSEERGAILQAIGGLGQNPSPQQTRVLQAALVKRWAT